MTPAEGPTPPGGALARDPEGPPASDSEAQFAERTRLLFDEAPGALIVMPGVAAVCAALLWGRVPSRALLGWLGAILAVTLLRAAALAAWRRASSPRPARWANAYAGVELASGLAWFGLGWLTLPAVSGGVQLLVLLTLGFMAVGAMPMLASVLRTYAAFLLGLGVPLTALAATLPGEAGAYLPSFMALFQVGMLLAAASLGRRIAASLAQGHENRRLLLGLEEVRRQLEEQNRALAVEVESRREAELAARAATSRFERLADATQEGVLLCRGEEVVDANARAAELLGVEVEALRGQPLSRLLPAVGPLASSPARIEAHLPRPGRDAGSLPVEVICRRGASDGEDDLGVVAVRDVSAQRQLPRLKDEFVARISHELRTPVTAIYGALKLIAAGAAGPEAPERLRAVAEVALRHGEGLRTLVDDLLDAQRLRAGELALERVAVRPRDAVEEVIRRRSAFAARFGVTFEVVEPLAERRVPADRRRLEQILANLADNAAKYGPEGEAVQLVVREVPQAARFEVIDRGDGVPEEFRAELFDPFVQADGGADRRREGSGLGLHVCAGLVELHGGRIGHEAAPGRSVFFVELPVDSAPRPAPARAPSPDASPVEAEANEG